MSGELTMRSLRALDGEGLVSFYNGLSDGSRRLFRPLGWETQIGPCQSIADETGGSTRFDLVLADGDFVLWGWAFLDGILGERAHLGIGVADAVQGKGWGKRLMAGLVEEARRRAIKEVRLIHVHDNIPAQSLYCSFGFRRTGEHVGDDGLLYTERTLILCGKVDHVLGALNGSRNRTVNDQ